MAYRLGEKTVLRSGFGIYYNPNQMNTFTFLTNNPPLSPEFTFQLAARRNPTLSLANPFGVVGPGGPPNVTSPNRHLPNARKDQWSFDVQRELWERERWTSSTSGSHTSNLDRSFFSNTPAPGAGSDRRAAAEPELPGHPPDPERPVRRTTTPSASSCASA